MKKLFLIFALVLAPMQISAAKENAKSFYVLKPNHVGQYFSKAGFGLGVLSVLSCASDRYDAGFSLGCLGIGSFLLSPLAEEVFKADYKLDLRHIGKFKKLLPCGLGGFACLAIGLRAMKGF